MTLLTITSFQRGPLPKPVLRIGTHSLEMSERGGPLTQRKFRILLFVHAAFDIALQHRQENSHYLWRNHLTKHPTPCGSAIQDLLFTFIVLVWECTFWAHAPEFGFPISQSHFDISNLDLQIIIHILT